MLSNHHHRLELDGNRLTVTPITEAVKQWWDSASGTVDLEQLRIPITQFKGNVAVDMQTGTISEDGLRIDWGNGTSWVYVGDA